MKKTKIAICYDFDLSLTPKNTEEFGLFADLGYTAEEFYAMVRQFIVENNSDIILTNMLMLIEKAKEKNIILTKEKLREYGKKVEFFNGVETWFERINEFGKNLGIEIEHYIVSSGQKEIIAGTSIAKYIKKIYAASYFYNEKGEPVWPKIAINSTNKMQFLYRVNKGCLEESDDGINNLIDGEQRNVPFENMIYIGDSLTDIPCMRLVMKKGGKAIGVYNEDVNKNYLKSLLENNKIDFIAQADYSKNSMLEVIVKEIIKSDKINTNLKNLTRLQKKHV